MDQSFSLEKESGRKCYVVGAKGLTIIWGDVPAYWDWISVPESRYASLFYILLLYMIDGNFMICIDATIIKIQERGETLFTSTTNK